MEIKEEYIKVLKSGMFYEFFPQFTGNWETDKDEFTKFYKNREAIYPPKEQKTT